MLEWIRNTMDSMGYAGVTFLMFLENVFPPIPSELIMPMAGYTAGRGDLNIWGAILAGTLGSVLGALPLYYLGRWAGTERIGRWADRWGKWITVRRQEVERADRWFDEHGGWAVFFCRMVPGVRSLISIPAGFAEMPLGPFLLYTTAGAAIWTAALGWLGKVLGENYREVQGYVEPVSYGVLALLAIAAIVWVVRRKRRRS